MNLNDLGSTPLADTVDMDALPEQMGTRQPSPPSGTYRFQLPRLTQDAFEKIETEAKGTRVSVIFGDDAPLTIVQAPPAYEDAFLKTPYKTRINNVPRKRGRGDDAPEASEWDYLNRALGEPTRPKSNLEFAQKLIARSLQNPPVTFQADIEGSYFCNDRRAARFADGNGGFTEIPSLSDAGTPVLGADGKPVMQTGCGMRYYEGDALSLPQGNKRSGTVAKINGQYPDHMTCLKCEADVRRFTNLTRFDK